ncbi:MAG TPA: hypothetical protein PK402_01820, partial [Tepidisphaeraceae bacterium]|nr:hypothetical protein [Tepidisphaeraceae bacterium]
MPDSPTIDPSGVSTVAEVAYAPKPAAAAVRRSFMRQLMHDTFVQKGAKVGITWVVVLAFFGCFAPLIANSHPIVIVEKNGNWSSPIWQSLSPVDLTLIALALCIFITAVIRRTKFIDMAISIVATVIIVAPLAYALKSSPDAVNYQKYRDLERSGSVQFMLRTLIPFSPTDRMRDMPEHRLRGPLATRTIATVTLHDGVQIVGNVEPIKDGYEIKMQGPVRTVTNAEVKSIDYQGFRYWHWLGTEVDGADLLSRMIHASRIAL